LTLALSLREREVSTPVTITLEPKPGIGYNRCAMNRSQLIDRKHEVIAELQRTRRELERERGKAGREGRVRELQARLDWLMAEEGRLRREIDRARD
ncbi:MAG: hypothetical protein KDG58_09570, partial [Anaerolineae bacterium]|nr:hypothetical protein [Anaerolineae bacterium]